MYFTFKTETSLVLFGLCKCVSHEKCGRDFAKMWVCSNVKLTVCGVFFVSVLFRHVLEVNSLLFIMGVVSKCVQVLLSIERWWII